MQKIHIDDFYRKVVPDGTPDCEPDPGFNYDKARKTTYLFLEIIFGQVFVDKIHVGFNQQVNCILPCHGGENFSHSLKNIFILPCHKGIYLDNLTLCTDPMFYEKALQLLPKLENDNTTLRLSLCNCNGIKNLQI